jgi:hypothetical protein
MGKVNHIQNAFNAGELSPRLASRFDFDKFSSGCYLMQNMIPTVQGSAIKRTGSYYDADLKQGSYVFLKAFTGTTGETYLIEIGDSYFRFFDSSGDQIMSGPSPFEVVTTYSAAYLPFLSFVQTGDVMYIFHRAYAPRKLTKNSSSDTDWTLAVVDFDWYPFQDTNPVDASEFYVSASSGSGIDITAVGHTPFTVGMDNIGLHIRLSSDISKITEWAAGGTVAIGDQRRYEDNVYKAATNTVTAANATLAPVHTRGTLSDGDVDWEYLHSGTGYVELKNYVSSTVMTADVIKYIPDELVGSGNETFDWAWGSWSFNLRGYPRCGTIHENRLIVACSYDQPQTVWGSVTGDYENFKAGVTDSDSFQYTIGSQELNDILWLSSSRVLLIGTDQREYSMSGSRIYEAITPTNIRIVPQTKYGSEKQQPIVSGDATLTVESGGRKVREMKYDYQSDSYIGVDKTVLSEHITYPGILRSAYQSKPYPVIWYPVYVHEGYYANSDYPGSLIGMTYDNAENVYAWHRQVLGGDAVILDCEVVRTGVVDRLFLAVKRTVNGTTVYYLEHIDLNDSVQQDNPEDHHYVDCGIVYDGAATTTITGLTHLEGETVSVLADGSTHPDKTVSSGQITLDRSSSKVHVGLPYTSDLQTMPIAEGGDYGPSHGQTAKISSIQLRLLNTGAGLYVGKDVDNLTEIDFRSAGMSMDGPVPLFTGLKGPKAWPTGQERDSRVYVRHTLPLPFELLAIILDMVVYDK